MAEAEATASTGPSPVHQAPIDDPARHEALDRDFLDSTITMPNDNRTMFVRPIGTVGVGKSSMLNGLAGYMEPPPRQLVYSKFFDSGNATAGMKVEERKRVSVNPKALGQGESMILGDAEGIGSSAGDSTVVFDRLLESLKQGNEPATLLVVCTFTRTELPLIKLLKLLCRCTSLSSDNCVLVLTRAADPENGIPASQADPSEWIRVVQEQTELDCFVKDKNVFCIDYYDVAYRKETTDRVRAALTTKIPVTAHTTYAELVTAAEELGTSNEKAREIAQAKLDVMKKDLAWHQRRIKDLSIATASTAWVPVFGAIASTGMAFAIADSQAKAKRFNEEIPEIEKLVRDASAAKEAAKAEVDLIRQYLS